MPTAVVVGRRDEQSPVDDILEGPHAAVRLEIRPGDHLLPLTRPDRLAQLIAELGGNR